VASHPAIARVAVRLTTLPVQPEVVVRRLGIDYHLEPIPSRRVDKTPVQSGRFKEAVKRVIRLRRYFPNGSAGLFAAGIGQWPIVALAIFTWPRPWSTASNTKQFPVDRSAPPALRPNLPFLLTLLHMTQGTRPQPSPSFAGPGRCG
jgi:hypothetical protein